MDYSQEAINIGIEFMDEVILKVTPDEIITKADKLVHIAVSKDLTGVQKAVWVLDQIKPSLGILLGFVGERLVQILYELMVAKRTV